MILSLVNLFTYRILDDIEMYEQQTPFRIGDYVLMSNFLNQFAYKAVLGGQLGLRQHSLVVSH